MRITRLKVQSFRNLSSVEILPGQGINLVYGENGSGKTSLLEAMHVLAVGRSFLTAHAKVFIQDGVGDTTIWAQVEHGDSVRSIGVRRALRGEVKARIDGREATSLAAVAVELPLVLLTPHSHELVCGGPRQRRGFVDWGLFHVEQSFLEGWRRMQRALRQRNAELRRGGSGSAWNEPFLDAAELVQRLRADYLDALKAPFLAWSNRLLGGMQFDIALHPGWKVDMPLGDVLESAQDVDRRDGYTHYGPHRAELRIMVDGSLAAERLSRGQEKLLVYALRLSQLELMHRRTGKSAVVLIDDVAAELDQDKRRVVLDGLVASEAQVFMTLTEAGLVPYRNAPSIRMFHVEHGQVTEVVQ